MSLEWIREGQWFEATKCGRYTMSASKVEDKFMFCAHVIATKETLGCDRNAELARSRCERHANPTPELDLPGWDANGSPQR